MSTPSSALLFLFFLLLLIVVSILFNKRRRRSRPKSTPNFNQQLELEEQEKEQDSPTTRLIPPPPPMPPPPPPPVFNSEEDLAAACGGGEEKRRKKKAKKKRSDAEGVRGCPDGDQAAAATVVTGFFSSPAGTTQRKMKAQYDELVKSNQAKQLTMAQVGQFVNCLVDAKNELQQKSEIIRRSFKIKKALLVKADRSSFDRLCQQIYKLEAEQKRLEEDAAVYNLLQEQLKLSPAYKTMVEVGTSMELQGGQDQAAVDFCDISFEELLAQEKKDSFWQRNGKLRSFGS